MPYAILKFKLPEEESEFTHAHKGLDYYCTIHDALNHIRGRLKYDDSLTEEAKKELEEVRKILWESEID